MPRRPFRRVRQLFRRGYHALLFGIAATAVIAATGGAPYTGGLLLACAASGIVAARLTRIPGAVWVRIALTPRRRSGGDE